MEDQTEVTPEPVEVKKYDNQPKLYYLILRFDGEIGKPVYTFVSDSPSKIGEFIRWHGDGASVAMFDAAPLKVTMTTLTSFKTSAGKIQGVEEDKELQAMVFEALPDADKF